MNLTITEWSKTKAENRGEKPPKPTRKRYLSKDINYDGLVSILQDNPRGILSKVDELSGYFTRMNKFTNGKGDDEQKDLSLFNGGSLSKDRMSASYFIPRSSVSVVGGIQWEKLQELQKQKGFEDSAGILSRWLFCAADLPDPYIDLKNDPDIDPAFYEANKTLTQKLLNLPEQDYPLSPGAKKRFQKFQHKLVDKRKVEPLAALASAYPKFETYTARIALILHLVWGVSNNNVEAVVSEETMAAAIKIVTWFMGQLRYILAYNNPSLKMEGTALKVLELLQKKQSLTISAAKNYNRSLQQLKNSEVEAVFKSLVNNGYAKCSEGKRFKIELLLKTQTISDKIQTESKMALNHCSVNDLEVLPPKTQTSFQTKLRHSKPLSSNNYRDFQTKTQTKNNFSSVVEESNQQEGFSTSSVDGTKNNNLETVSDFVSDSPQPIDTQESEVSEKRLKSVSEVSEFSKNSDKDSVKPGDYVSITYESLEMIPQPHTKQREEYGVIQKEAPFIHSSGWMCKGLSGWYGEPDTIRKMSKNELLDLELKARLDELRSAIA